MKTVLLDTQVFLWMQASRARLGSLSTFSKTRTPESCYRPRVPGRSPSNHGDPFDRLLISQALTEGIPLVTADPAMRTHDAELIWVG